MEWPLILIIMEGSDEADSDRERERASDASDGDHGAERPERLRNLAGWHATHIPVLILSHI